MKIETTIDIEQSKRIGFFLKVAPELYGTTIRRWLIAEVATFVGTKKRDGLFRRRLMRQKTLYKDGMWESRVARLFKGYVDGRGIAQTAHMGIGLSNNPKPFSLGIALMQTGGRISSSKQMPIPNIEGIKQAGYSYSGGKKDGLFAILSRQGKLQPIKSGGNTVWFLKDGSVSEPLFFGTNQVNIPKKINFYEDWDSRKSGAPARAARYMDRANNKAMSSLNARKSIPTGEYRGI